MKKSQITEYVKSRPFQYLLVGAIVIGLLFWWGYNAAKRKFKSSSASVPYPDGGSTLPAGGRAVLDELVSQTFDVLDGFDFSQAKELVFQRYASLTNDQVTYIYKAWNARYEQAEGKTLTKRIEAETFPTTAMDTVTNRLRSLNLF